jgi:2-amino-4-hydroxy-6-hydroxymethyldihydropteridine diphosphokinase
LAANEVLLGLGANLGEPIRQLRQAVERLTRVLSALSVSSLYRSAPVGYHDQSDFYNLVCRGRTDLPPLELLRITRHIEDALGRERSFPNAPRTLDIDMLAYEGLVLDTPELILPHPRLQQRAFVLLPLAEVAPYWRHPVLGNTAAELLAAAGPLERIERWGPLPAGE